MTTCPIALPQTGELNQFKAQDEATATVCKNSTTVQIEPETITRSGHLAYFPYAGAQYSMSTLLCPCAGIDIELAADGTACEYLNATYTCAQHGTHQSTAIRCATPSGPSPDSGHGQTSKHKSSPVFAWVEQRHARDRRVAWGMAQRRTT